VDETGEVLVDAPTIEVGLVKPSPRRRVAYPAVTTWVAALAAARWLGHPAL
jgi:hypothetical protein